MNPAMNDPWSSVFDGAGRSVTLCEVGPRDGLQAETVFVPTADKIALVNALAAAGLRHIEVTAFVSPQAIPALRDAEVVMREIERRPGVVYGALVPNVRGAERAIESGVDELNLVMSASESHSLANLRMLREQSITALAQVAALARSAGRQVNLSLSCSFGCPMEGEVPAATVLELLRQIAEHIQPQGVTLCDTTGMAYPAQVLQLASAVARRWPALALTLHFHNTRGMGLANVLAGLAAGARRFDAALGGLGGCPYAPGASGNVCTEEVAQALALSGWATGIDDEALLAAARTLPGLVGHDVPSQLVKAGLRLHLHPPPSELPALRERALAKG